MVEGVPRIEQARTTVNRLTATVSMIPHFVHESGSVVFACWLLLFSKYRWCFKCSNYETCINLTFFWLEYVFFCFKLILFWKNYYFMSRNDIAVISEWNMCLKLIAKSGPAGPYIKFRLPLSILKSGTIFLKYKNTKFFYFVK